MNFCATRSSVAAISLRIFNMNAIDESLIAAISANDSVIPSKPKRRYGCSLVPVAYSSDDEPVQASVDTRPRVLFSDYLNTVADVAA
jgi:hypothetical protein